MSRRTQGIVLVVAGILVALIAALADVLRVGMLAGTFGVVQIVGVVVGIALLIGGIVLLARGAGSQAA